MTDEKNDQSSAFFDQSFWDELKKLETGDEWSLIADLGKQAITRNVTSAELEYILRNYAYLEISDAANYDPKLVDPQQVTFSKSRSGWLIHDHGTVLRASPGILTYRYHNLFNETKDPMADDDKIGYGTIVQQYVDTTRDMLKIAQSRWPGAKVLSGYRPMQFAAYLIAQAAGYLLEGVELTNEEARTYQYVKQYIQIAPTDKPEPDRMPR